MRLDQPQPRRARPGQPGPGVVGHRQDRRPQPVGGHARRGPGRPDQRLARAPAHQHVDPATGEHPAVAAADRGRHGRGAHPATDPRHPRRADHRDTAPARRSRRRRGRCRVVSSSRTRVDRRTRAQERSESGELSTTRAVVLPKGNMPRHAPRAGAPRRFRWRFQRGPQPANTAQYPEGSVIGRSARRSPVVTGAGIWKTPPLTGASSARQPHETPSDQHRNHPVAGHDQAGEPEPGRTGESEGAAS